MKVEGEGELSELVQCGLQPPVGDRGVKLSCLKPPIGRLGQQLSGFRPPIGWRGRQLPSSGSEDAIIFLSHRSCKDSLNNKGDIERSLG